jgi:hypothetical protein
MCDAPPGRVLVHDVCGIVATHDLKIHPWDGHEREWSLRGVLLVDNLIGGMRDIARELKDQLSAIAPERSIHIRRLPHSQLFESPEIEELSLSAGSVLIGLGNCGACTTWLCDLADLIADYTPVAVLATEQFRELAVSRLSALGQASLPIVTISSQSLEPTSLGVGSVAAQIIEQRREAWGIGEGGG